MGKDVRHEVREEGPEHVGSHGVGCAVARVLGRAHAALALLLVVVVAFGAHVPRAFAANQYNPEMVIDGNLVDGTREGYMCVNCNQFTATLELIGKMGDYVTITSDKYDRLVASGGFHDAMERWQELTSDAIADMQNTWLGGDGFVDGWLILSGQGNCWYGTFSEDEIQEALDSYEGVMNGGGGTGVGGITQDGNYIELHVPKLNAVWGYDMDMFVLRIKKGTGMYNAIVNTNRDTSTVSICVHPTGNNSGEVYTCLYVTPKSVVIDELEKGDNKYLGTVTNGRANITIHYINSSLTLTTGGEYNATVNSSNVVTQAFDGHLIYCGDGITAGRTSYDSLLNMYGNKCYVDWAWVDVPADGVNVVPDPEPEPDPEPDLPEEPGPSPTAPEPPDLPDIGDPTVPREPDPTPPTTEPTPPTLPTPITVTVPTGTSPADYTPWLRAILEELKNINAALNSYLQSIIDEMAEHCQHIRDEMGVQASYLGECLDSVASAAAGVGDQIEGAMHDYSEWLSEYLDGLAEWMVEHMSFNTTVENNVTADPYDDTSLMYWIKRIYTKLGAGSPVNSRPKDPVSNPTETNTWWEELWEKILRELANMFPNLAIDLGLIFDDLKGKFPFSIPWDLHALLLLMVTDPVAPHVQIPAYALTADMELEQVATYDMDFDVYTPYMTGIHLMFEVAWVGYLLSKTKDYMQLIEGVIPS